MGIFLGQAKVLYIMLLGEVIDYTHALIPPISYQRGHTVYLSHGPAVFSVVSSYFKFCCSLKNRPALYNMEALVWIQYSPDLLANTKLNCFPLAMWLKIRIMLAKIA